MYNDGVSRSPDLDLKNIIGFILVLYIFHGILSALGYSVSFLIFNGFRPKPHPDPFLHYYFPGAFLFSIILFKSWFVSISKIKLKITNPIMIIEFFMFCIFLSLAIIPFQDTAPVIIRNVRLMKTPINLAFISPVFEEIVFRLLLLNYLIKKFKGKIIFPLIISSLLFSLLHFLSPQSFVYGLFLGLVYLATRNILIPMLFHVAWNSRITLEHLQIYPKSLENNPEALSLVFLILSGLLLIILIMQLTIMLIKRKKLENLERPLSPNLEDV